MGTTTPATVPLLMHPMRSLSTVRGTPPRASKQEARATRVVSERWLSAKYTKRTRLQASTAQSTDSDPICPQSMTNMSPGAHTPGRRPRWWSARQARLALTTRRRKLRAEPS